MSVSYAESEVKPVHQCYLYPFFNTDERYLRFRQNFQVLEANPLTSETGNPPKFISELLCSVRLFAPSYAAPMQVQILHPSVLHFEYVIVVDLELIEEDGFLKVKRRLQVPFSSEKK